MMLKLNQNSLSSLDQYTTNTRMFANMCIFPHVDAMVFCKIARKYRLAAFLPGDGYVPTRDFVLAVCIKPRSRLHTLNRSGRCWLSLTDGFVVRLRGHARACGPCTQQLLRAS